MAKTYEVVGPYPIAVLREDGKGGRVKADVPPPDLVKGQPGGQFTEDEIEPGCDMSLNVRAGLVSEVAPGAKPKSEAAGK